MDSKSLSLIVFAALLWAINVSALRSNSANQPYWHGYPYPDPKGKSQPQQVFYQPSQSNGYPLSPSDYGSMQTQWVSSSPRDIYSSWGVDELTANPTPSAPNNVRRRSSRNGFQRRRSSSSLPDCILPNSERIYTGCVLDCSEGCPRQGCSSEYKAIPMEGLCTCKDGFALSPSNQCIPKNECPPSSTSVSAEVQTCRQNEVPCAQNSCQSDVGCNNKAIALTNAEAACQCEPHYVRVEYRLHRVCLPNFVCIDISYMH